jgi:hypothetical protein
MSLLPAAPKDLKSLTVLALDVKTPLQSIVRHLHAEDLTGMTHHSVAERMDPQLSKLI